MADRFNARNSLAIFWLTYLVRLEQPGHEGVAAPSEGSPSADEP